MATAHDNYEKGLVGGDIESGSDKGNIQHVDHDGKGVEIPAVATASRPAFEPPELVKNMTPEQRIETEAKLKRKIDIRLMPMIVLMYIMNYLDRNNIAAAKLAGILTDLKLKGPEFQVSCY
jgi:hypothetical protein